MLSQLEFSLSIVQPIGASTDDFHACVMILGIISVYRRIKSFKNRIIGTPFHCKTRLPKACVK